MFTGGKFIESIKLKAQLNQIQVTWTDLPTPSLDLAGAVKRMPADQPSEIS